MKFQLTSRCK